MSSNLFPLDTISFRKICPKSTYIKIHTVKIVEKNIPNEYILGGNRVCSISYLNSTQKVGKKVLDTNFSKFNYISLNINPGA